MEPNRCLKYSASELDRLSEVMLLNDGEVGGISFTLVGPIVLFNGWVLSRRCSVDSSILFVENVMLRRDFIGEYAGFFFGSSCDGLLDTDLETILERGEADASLVSVLVVHLGCYWNM